MQLFLDMDGVLADFDAGYLRQFGRRPDKQKDDVDWDAVCAVPDFYLNLPPMLDMPELMRHVAKYDPIVLTGVPRNVPEAPANKEAWVRRHLGPHREIRCCPSRDKCLHASPGDILVDDWERYRNLWIAKGGIWITHRSAAETILELLELGLV